MSIMGVVRLKFSCNLTINILIDYTVITCIWFLIVYNKPDALITTDIVSGILITRILIVFPPFRR